MSSQGEIDAQRKRYEKAKKKYKEEGKKLGRLTKLKPKKK